MKETLIFVNPISGQGRGMAIAGRLERTLAAFGMHPRMVLDKADVAELPGLDKVSAAICVGGDGTLREVAQRLVDFTLGAGLNVVPFPLAIVPMGTANLMALHTGNLWRDQGVESELPRALQRGRIRLVDVGCTPRGIFLLMAGVGPDGQIIHELARQRGGPISVLSYVRPTWNALWSYGFPEVSVAIDGREVLSMQQAIVFIGNAPEYGTGFPLLSHARTDDGLLDVLVLPAETPRDLIRHAMAMMTGEHTRQEGAVYARGRHVQVTSSRPIPVQIDGEAAGFTPLTADLLPVRVPFIVAEP